jgi:predicted RNA-binding Zn-ribbon protein involved in translation (DUF1610 family)
MASIPNISEVLASAPQVACPQCMVKMTLRVLDPSEKKLEMYTATFRCPRCGDDTKREFECSSENAES